ncbi:MAG: zinc-ribbon domain-containing protein [Candidatus Lokiarchaeota archaeon]|nr:zinc-ribbon domain-containing protein [Candidatus Lokiarchaeota archaeon]
MANERVYEGTAEFWSTLGVAIAFTIVGTISVLFNIFRFDFIGLRWWGFWLYIPAFFIWISAISTYQKNKRAQKMVKGTLESYKDARISLDDLASETMIKKGDLLRVLMDLRTDGKIKYRYDRNNGDILLGEYKEGPKPEKKASEPEKPKSKSVYCPYCGAPVTDEDKFCYKCGSSIK